jgi:dihydrodipicolinate synthase/N-acetylneuraminate lyase
LGLTFLLPELAVAEARTLRPHADAMVDELVSHPHVVLTRMSSADAAGVEELLDASRTFDVMAGWGWFTYAGSGNGTR